MMPNRHDITALTRRFNEVWGQWSVVACEMSALEIENV
jgi:hypothetical protein